MAWCPSSASPTCHLPGCNRPQWTAYPIYSRIRRALCWYGSRRRSNASGARGWEERAEEHLPRLLGLPGGWPHLSFEAEPGRPPRHWKLGAIESHAGPDRPVAWLDDSFDASCDAWAAERRAPTLLVRTDPATGLREEHVTLLEEWARRL